MKNRVFFIVALCFINLVHGQSKKFNLLIGTFISTSNCDGIYVYDFDSQTGDFNYKSKVAGENPRYLAISRDGNNMYSVNTIRNGGISAFSFD